MSKKYVLTGGPCTGKTTTLNGLSEKGFHIVPEASRMVIEHQQSIGGRALPWVDFDLFQIVNFHKQIQLESSVRDGVTAFLDRGVSDSIAYHKLMGVEVPRFIAEASKFNKYNGVFLLEVLPNYEKDSARIEDPETARKVHELLGETYTELGYDVVRVPPLSIGERIEFILSNL